MCRRCRGERTSDRRRSAPGFRQSERSPPIRSACERPSTAASGAPARGERTMHLLQRPRRIGHVHQSERADGNIERRIGEVQRFRVHPSEGCVSHTTAQRFRACALHHLVGDVGAGDSAGRPGRRRGLKRHQTGAAGDIEHPFSVANIRENAVGDPARVEAARPKTVRSLRRPCPSRSAEHAAGVWRPRQVRAPLVMWTSRFIGVALATISSHELQRSAVSSTRSTSSAGRLALDPHDIAHFAVTGPHRHRSRQARRARRSRRESRPRADAIGNSETRGPHRVTNRQARSDRRAAEHTRVRRRPVAAVFFRHARRQLPGPFLDVAP